MSDLNVFFNTKIEGSGALASIGDFGLTPLRYLCSGKTLRLEQKDGSKEIEIHRVSHKNGQMQSFSVKQTFVTSCTNMIKTLAAIVLLVPGLFLSLFKGFAYIFSDVREKHHLAKQFLTQVNKHIGSVENPIKDIGTLKQLLKSEAQNKRHSINALIIHGDNLAINEDPGILALNPKKLILEGARMVHRPSPETSLDEAMKSTRKWQIHFSREVTRENPDISFAQIHTVKSLDEALQTERHSINWPLSCKRYHMIFQIAKPQATA